MIIYNKAHDEKYHGDMHVLCKETCAMTGLYLELSLKIPVGH